MRTHREFFQDLARQLITVQNEKLAELCAAQPDRFVAFATVALQYPDLAAEQLEDGIKRLGLRGVSIGGSVNGEELSDPKFHPFWAKAEARASWFSCIRRASRTSTNGCRATAC